MSSIAKYIKNPYRIFLPLAARGWFKTMDDEKYLKLMFRARMGRKLNLKNPQTFNEKLQWLKLYDRKPEYSDMVDKYEAKRYVADRIGEEYIIPTLGVWDSFDEIDFSSLPNQFVLKCTHDSGGLVICKDKANFDIDEARRKINRSLANDYYLWGREWPYKNVKHRIIAEKYMEDSKTSELRDYKIFTFDGVAKALFIAANRQTGKTTADYFDMDFKPLDFTWGYPHSKVLPSKPDCFDEMIKVAECLAKGTAELRVDFYEVNGKAYFGEMTFFDGSGFDKFDPEEWDAKFGKLIKLPISNGGGYAVIHNGWVIWVHLQKRVGLIDYKFYCFNGVPKYLYVSQGMDNHATARLSFATINWELAPFGRSDYPQMEELPEKPKHFGEMLDLAKKLSNNHPFLRVDLYEIDNHVYFSELTFSPCDGFMPFNPKEYDLKLGEMVNLAER